MSSLHIFDQLFCLLDSLYLSSGSNEVFILLLIFDF